MPRIIYLTAPILRNDLNARENINKNHIKQDPCLGVRRRHPCNHDPKHALKKKRTSGKTVRKDTNQKVDLDMSENRGSQYETCMVGL